MTETKKIKTIGILTSGGDAPGMNAAIRSVTLNAIRRGIRVLGIRHGYQGLFDKNIYELTEESVSDILARGGTVLYSARFPEFKEQSVINACAENCKQFGIDGIVAIGGDGTFRGARDLTLAGVPCIGIPGTIDNDIVCSDYTLGFDTAINTCISSIDRITDTSQSHDRCTVVEIMGAGAGHLALAVGVAVGATAILVPEREIDLRDIADRIEKIKLSNKRHFVIAVAEGCKKKQNVTIEQVAEFIEKETGIESKTCVLGHVQRGGSPTGTDRVMAAKFGDYAVDLLCKNISSCVVVTEKEKILHIDIVEALQRKKYIDAELFAIADRVHQ